MPAREVDRIAGATAHLFESLDARVGELQRTVEKLREEVRGEMRQIESTVQAISGDIRQMHGENVSKSVEELRGLCSRYDERLRALETWQSNLAGRLAVIGAAYATLITIVIAVVVKWLTK